eukprot:1648884-Amphidinium_carterae.1
MELLPTAAQVELAAKLFWIVPPACGGDYRLQRPASLAAAAAAPWRKVRIDANIASCVLVLERFGGKNAKRRELS